MNYLMLDANDITKVCGIISRKELLKEMSIAKLQNLLDHPNLHPFRDKYVLVEEHFDKKIGEGKRGTYYATSKGEVYIIYSKSQKKKYLSKVIKSKRNCVEVRIGYNTYLLKNLIAKAFLGVDENYVVKNKNGNIYDCSVDNLVITKRKDYYDEKRRKAHSKPVGLFENGVMVKSWSSAVECAKDMFIAPSCVREYCHGKVQKPQFDFRWI